MALVFLDTEPPNIEQDELLQQVAAELAGIDSRAPPLLARVVGAVRGGRLRTPLMPERALELLNLTNAREVSFDALAKVAVQDPAVATTVMRIASSAAFAPSSRPSDIKDALVRLGTEGVRQVAYDVAISSRVARRGRFLPVLERILRHGRTTSALARILAKELGLPPGPAALMGLLHAAGGMVIVDEISGQRDQRPCADVVAYLLVRRLHSWVGERILGQLGLGADVIDAIATHHQIGAESSTMARLMAFVDSIAPSEPAQRVVPLQLALERSGLPLSARIVVQRLQPIISTVEDIRLSHLSHS